jgi:hypothetical protein
MAMGDAMEETSHRRVLCDLFPEHQLCAFLHQIVVHFRERAADEVNAETARLYEIEGPPLEVGRITLFSEVP